jgi:hypothetical protein
MIEFDVLNIFKDVLKYDNPPEEQKHALNCLWSMSFEEKVLLSPQDKSSKKT